MHVMHVNTPHSHITHKEQEAHTYIDIHAHTYREHKETHMHVHTYIHTYMHTYAHGNAHMFLKSLLLGLLFAMTISSYQGLGGEFIRNGRWVMKYNRTGF